MWNEALYVLLLLLVLFILIINLLNHYLLERVVKDASLIELRTLVINSNKELVDSIGRISKSLGLFGNGAEISNQLTGLKAANSDLLVLLQQHGNNVAFFETLKESLGLLPLLTTLNSNLEMHVKLSQVRLGLDLSDPKSVLARLKRDVSSLKALDSRKYAALVRKSGSLLLELENLIDEYEIAKLIGFLEKQIVSGSNVGLECNEPLPRSNR
jgi:hypothetical protein